MTKNDLDYFKNLIQHHLKAADHYFKDVENLAKTEVEKDFLFDYLYNSSGKDNYNEMIENEVEKILEKSRLTKVKTGVY